LSNFYKITIFSIDFEKYSNIKYAQWEKWTDGHEKARSHLPQFRKQIKKENGG
jgi:hypothetical protein